MGRWLLALFIPLALVACDTSTAEPTEDATAVVVEGTETLLITLQGWGDVMPPSGSYALGQSLTLEATPQKGWVFGGWTGDVEGGDNPLTVTMDGDLALVATFYQPTPYPNWNGTAVRKVLQTFAWGGFATDDQIALWAAMPPTDAIEEMLTFEPINERLSPSEGDGLAEGIAAFIPEDGGQLEGIARYFAADPDGLIDPERRLGFDIENYPAPAYSWDMAARSRGLNTFYHRIGFWETNYHMATNQRAGVAPHPMIRHYDNIMGKLRDGAPYHAVVAKGALNSAVAYQYGHNFNAWDSAKGEFRGNEDFAREFHQLFFGILGEAAFGGEDYHLDHELISISNTAKALTGMAAYYRIDGVVNRLPTGFPDVEVDFEEELHLHHHPSLEILDTLISGGDAREKIEALAEVAIDHPESLHNLPVIIASNLADDNLSEAGKEAIREMWSGPTNRTLLDFLRRYAVSDLYHSPERLKYHSSYDRNLFIHNRMQLSNQELYGDTLGQNPLFALWESQQLEPFNPVHNVFGQQTSVEAFNDPEVFKNAYNRSTEDVAYYETGFASEFFGMRDWQVVIPADDEGKWRVKYVARYLWQRFIADGLKHFGPLEEAHLYAILGARTGGSGEQGMDLGLYLDASDPERVYTVEELQREPNLSRIVALGQEELDLGAASRTVRMRPNGCIQRAIAFIAATPYAFLQEGQ
ncbi:MAG: InlB B-repeat-containing protein [Myxococcota bacterium]